MAGFCHIFQVFPSGLSICLSSVLLVLWTMVCERIKSPACQGERGANGFIGFHYCCLVAKSYLTLLQPPWTVAFLALLSMVFSRQEYWSDLPFPSSEDLPNSGTEPMSFALAC